MKTKTLAILVMGLIAFGGFLVGIPDTGTVTMLLLAADALALSVFGSSLMRRLE